MAEVTQAAQPAQSGWLDTVGNWITKAGQIFKTGADVYVAVDQRVKALESIDEDAGTTRGTATERANVLPAMPSWVMPAVAVGLVLVGILVARKLR